MFEGRKLKKAVRECTKTEKSFEQFCAEHDIRLPPRPEKQAKSKKPFWVAFASAAAAAVLVLCVSLPFLLKNDKDDGGSGLPGIIEPEYKDYGEFDVELTKIAYEDLSEDTNLFLLDSSGIQDSGDVFKIQTKEDDNICVGYRISEILFGFQIGDDLFAYQINYMAKTYSRFTAAEQKDFNDLTEKVTENGIDYAYKLFENRGKTTAYIAFEKNDYEYYLTVTDFEGLTEINKENVEKLIVNAL